MIANFFRGFRLAESAVIFGSVFFVFVGFFFSGAFWGFFFLIFGGGGTDGFATHTETQRYTGKNRRK